MVLCGIVFVVSMGMRFFFRKRAQTTPAKMAGVLGIMAMLGFLAAAVAEDTASENPVLQRNKNGEGSYEEEFLLGVEGLLEDYDYVVEVPEQILSAEEEQALIEAAIEEMEQEFSGANASVNHICERVVIRETYQQDRVKAEWIFDNYKVMDFEGNVIAEELDGKGELVGASVLFTCGKTSYTHEFFFHVYPREESTQEKLLRLLQEELSARGEAVGAQELRLPEKVLDYKLTWTRREDHMPEKILLMGILLSVGVFFSEKEKVQKRQRERAQKLALEYSDMVSKLALLLGAGMTPAGAWKRIAASYSDKRQKNQIEEMPVYEEMLITCHEMEGGIGEERAYERFGERCGQKRYRKLGGILTQNLRKGTRGLTSLLEAEAEDALEERKQAARKYGEEAGTKLLLPMIIMLGVVMVILMVPAVLSFQM